MKMASIQDARAAFADTIAQADAEPVVLTCHGRPVGMLLGRAETERILAAIELGKTGAVVAARPRRKAGR